MSEDRPILYGRYASPFVRRVAVTLELYGLKYRHMPMMPFGPDKSELAKFNPIARVPALQLADSEMLIDSAVILDYLDSLAGPERALTPAAGKARRRVLTLLAVAHGANEKLVVSLYERHFRRGKNGIGRGWRPATSRCATAFAGSMTHLPAHGFSARP